MTTESTTTGTDARTNPEESKHEQRCDLSKFKLRVLAVLAASESAPKGLTVKARLEEYYGGEVNHGRLYPNLDDLVSWGLVEKGQKDRRTNSYAISEAGHEALAAEVAWLSERINGGECA